MDRRVRRRAKIIVIPRPISGGGDRGLLKKPNKEELLRCRRMYKRVKRRGGGGGLSQTVAAKKTAQLVFILCPIFDLSRGQPRVLFSLKFFWQNYLFGGGHFL